MYVGKVFTVRAFIRLLDDYRVFYWCKDTILCTIRVSLLRITRTVHIKHVSDLITTILFSGF